jgi:hypothetical protein
MLDEPAFRLTNERAIEILRNIMDDYSGSKVEPRGLDMIPEVKL